MKLCCMLIKTDVIVYLPYTVLTLHLCHLEHGCTDVFCPVSYTHLDVYKRQGVGRPSSGEVIGILPQYRKEVIKDIILCP